MPKKTLAKKFDPELFAELENELAADVLEPNFPGALLDANARALGLDPDDIDRRAGRLAAFARRTLAETQTVSLEKSVPERAQPVVDGEEPGTVALTRGAIVAVLRRTSGALVKSSTSVTAAETRGRAQMLTYLRAQQNRNAPVRALFRSRSPDTISTDELRELVTDLETVNTRTKQGSE